VRRFLSRRQAETAKATYKYERAKRSTKLRAFQEVANEYEAK